MACFVVPVAEAIVTMAVTRAVRARETEPRTVQVADDHGGSEIREALPFSQKLKWLSHLLWGGAVLLLFEHIWHGEVTATFPFLTAASDPAGMLHEMATVGVTMSALVTAVWVGMLAVSSAMEKRAARDLAQNGTEEAV